MSELTKICKECGKSFVPDNPRQNFCKAEHYRPCPVCSKPVLIKYLTDPTPCCSKECSKKKRYLTSHAVAIPAASIDTPVVESPSTTPTVKESAVADTASPSNDDNAPMMGFKYMMPFKCGGFIPNHVYDMRYRKEPGDNLYTIEATIDYTTGDEIYAMLHLTSMNSINRYFQLT